MLADLNFESTLYLHLCITYQLTNNPQNNLFYYLLIFVTRNRLVRCKMSSHEEVSIQIEISIFWI